MFTGLAAVLGGMYLGGKGTNAEWFLGRFSDYFVHQTTSGLLSRHEEAIKLMRAGKMVPNAVVYRAVETYLASLGSPKGLIADGWVRVVRQANQIYARLQRFGYSDVRFIEFQVEDDDILEARRKERYLKLRRPDDEFKVAWKRIREYRKRSAAVLRASADAGFRVITIDASRPLADVNRQFARAIIV